MLEKLIYNDPNKTIDDLINVFQSGQYFSIVRVGGTDYDLSVYGEKMIEPHEKFGGYYDLDRSQEHMNEYRKLTPETIRNATMLVLGNIIFLSAFEKRDFSESYFSCLTENCNAELHRYCAFESFHRFGEWFSCLAGKKILLVSPFKNSIQQQYKQKEKLFAFDYPEFSLNIVQTPVTLSAVKNYPDRNTLETATKIINEIDQVDFDIALLGCGAYTSPVVNHLQKRNKSHIVLGGMLQMYFGVYGGRYETPFFRQWINDSWIKPLASDKLWNEIEISYISDGVGAYF